MSAPDSSAQIVARFLRANHYNETLEAFIREAGLPEDAGSLTPGAWTIEQILQEKLQFDASINFEKHGGTESKGWSTAAPSHYHEPQMDITSNVLCVNGNLEGTNISVTTADRSWKRCTTQTPYAMLPDNVRAGDSPVLSTVFMPGNLLLAASMSGHLSLRNALTYSLIDQCRHHSKYAVQVASIIHGPDWFVATAGWDQKIHVYAPKLLEHDASEYENASDIPSSSSKYLGEPIHTISFTTNPESILFARHPDKDEVYLIASRRDSTHLYYYKVQRQPSGEVAFLESGRQNLAPHSNAWVAFTPCSLTLCPTDPTLVAVATSHLPHMKLIIARLLFPISKTSPDAIASEPRTQAAAARAELALQDREDTAIRIQVTTMAPQTSYSTPQVVWRPDGSGVFVNGDDGVIRGIEATTGKVVTLLKGHEAGSKVRTLWAGLVNHDSHGPGQEILVSGGFDKRLLIWTAEETN